MHRTNKSSLIRPKKQLEDGVHSLIFNIDIFHRALMLVKSMFLTRGEKQYTYEILILLDLYQGRFSDTEEYSDFIEFSTKGDFKPRKKPLVLKNFKKKVFLYIE